MPSENLVALTSGGITKVGNQVFRKQLLRIGRWVHPTDTGKFFEVTKSLCDQLVSNFNENNYNDFIPVMMAQDQAEPHKVVPTDSLGRIVGLQSMNDGLYSLMEFNDTQAADKASKNLIPGVSATLYLDYHNKEKNQNVGAVLGNVVLCNEPYIKNLRGFEQVEFSEQGVKFGVIEFSEVIMTREQLIEEAKKLGMDIPALEAGKTELADTKVKVEKHDVLLAENTSLKTELAELKKEKPENATVVELGERLNTVVSENNALKGQVATLELASKTQLATSKVDKLISEGKMIPAQKETMIKLAVANEPLFTELTANAPRVVHLGEQGAQTGDQKIGSEMSGEQKVTEIDRISKMVAGKK